MNKVESMLSSIFSGNKHAAMEQFNQIISQRALNSINDMKPDVGTALFNTVKEDVDQIDEAAGTDFTMLGPINPAHKSEYTGKNFKKIHHHVYQDGKHVATISTNRYPTRATADSALKDKYNKMPAGVTVHTVVAPK